MINQKTINSEYYKHLKKEYGEEEARRILNNRKKKLGVNFKEMGKKLTDYLAE